MTMTRLLTAGLLAWAAATAHADIVLADVGPFSGPLAENGNANHAGAKAYIDRVNAEGGVHGQRLRLVKEDDQYKPDETVRLLQLVAQRDKPVAFLNVLGSANVTALLKDDTLGRIATPVVGVTPGAESLRTPGSPWLFHTHAGDKAQFARILGHVSTLGLSRVAVIYQDIPFGKSGLALVEGLAPSLKVTIAAKVAVPAGADDLKPAIAALQGVEANVYLMILATNSGPAFVRDLRAAGNLTPIYGMSYTPVKTVVAKAGAGASVGVTLAQVTPNPFSRASGLTRDFHTDMDKHAPGADHSQLHLIGYLNARVAVEGLRRAGPAPTPERLAAALRRLNVDLGDYLVNFDNGQVGSQYVNIGAIDRSGKLIY